MPEKSLREISRPLREQYEKGKAAFERNNLDYAITILTAVLEQEPSFYDCREALRATQFKRGGSGGATAFFKKVLSKSGLPRAMAVFRRDPLEALKLCEQTLNRDPHGSAAHKLLADAALAADLPKTAVLSLEIVHRQSPQDKEVGLKLARALTLLSQWARAESILEALQQATRAYAASRRLVPGQRVLERRQLRVLRQMAGMRVRQLLARSDRLVAVGKHGEAHDLLVLAESMTRAVLPPALNDPDPASTDRVGAAALATAVSLRLGRCARARTVLGQARADLSDERRERPLNDLLAAVEAWATGNAVAPPPTYAWVFAQRAPCRAEGLAPVRRVYDAYVGAEANPQQPARRIAAKRLAAATERQGSEVAVLAGLRGLPPAKDPRVQALRAALFRKMDPPDRTLAGLLAGDEADLRRAALIEAGWWGFLRRHAAAMDRALAATDAATRKALATAAAERGHVAVLRRVVELLMDADLDVRKEAWSVFLQHRPVLIEAYDPRAPADVRRPIYERIKASLVP